MKIMKNLLRLVAIFFVSKTYILSVYAIDIPLPPSPTPDKDLLDFVYRVINLSIGLAGLVAVVFLIYNGIRYILSAGDEGKVEKATKGITYAIIGLVICFVSVLIVNFILNNVIQATI